MSDEARARFELNMSICDLRGLDREAVLALNNAHAVETSLLDAGRLDMLLRRSCFAAAVGDLEAMLIAFDDGADYDSVNFQWFRTRLPRFVYVDRVITAPWARGRGHARLLYQALFARASAEGHDRVVCEVNVVPANPGSDRFHAALGFREVGRADIGQGKTVRYLERLLRAGI